MVSMFSVSLRNNSALQKRACFLFSPPPADGWPAAGLARPCPALPGLARPCPALPAPKDGWMMVVRVALPASQANAKVRSKEGTLCCFLSFSQMISGPSTALSQLPHNTG